MLNASSLRQVRLQRADPVARSRYGALNVGSNGRRPSQRRTWSCSVRSPSRWRSPSRTRWPIEQIAELKDKLSTEKLYLEEEIRTEHNFEEIVGESSALRRVLKQVETVAPTDSTVLIQGETGTGKELIARAIHNLSGRRGAHVRQAELRRHPDRPARERAVRPREGRVHRRDRAADRPLRAGARRHAVPRRGRRHPAGAAAQAAARAAGAGVRAPRRHADDPRGRAAGGGDEPRPRRRWSPTGSSAATSTTG